MKFGVAVLHHGEKSSKNAIDKVAELAEKLEYDSIWVSDHIITPKKEGKTYGFVFEALSTLSYLAAKTENLLLGTSVIVLPMRDAVLFAKQVATIDVLSEGRLIIGLGIGWLKEEFDFLGKEFANRAKVIEEQIKLIKKLWSDEEIVLRKNGTVIEYYFEPKPVQRGGPKIIMGGNAKRAIIRASKLGDGWNPIALSPRILEEKINFLNRITKDKKKLIFLRIGVLPEITSAFKMIKSDTSYYLSGSLREITEDLERYERIGVDKIIAYFGSVDLEEYLERMKKFKEVMKSFHS